jgi:hypothetical protein
MQKGCDIEVTEPPLVPDSTGGISIHPSDAG